MMFGCQPSKFVLSDTRMLYDLFDSLNSRFDPKTLALELPLMFEDLQSDAAVGDAKWEIWRSNQIQKVKLFYENNKVTQREGFIFCTTHVDNKYQDLEGDARMEQLGKEFVKLRMSRTGKSEDVCQKEWEAKDGPAREK